MRCSKGAEGGGLESDGERERDGERKTDRERKLNVVNNSMTPSPCLSCQLWYAGDVQACIVLCHWIWVTTFLNSNVLDRKANSSCLGFQEAHKIRMVSSNSPLARPIKTWKLQIHQND